MTDDVTAADHGDGGSDVEAQPAVPAHLEGLLPPQLKVIKRSKE